MLFERPTNNRLNTTAIMQQILDRLDNLSASNIELREALIKLGGKI